MTASDSAHRGDWCWCAALPPLLASLAVLSIAGVGGSLWGVHLAAIVLALFVAALGRRLLRPEHASVVVPVVAVLAPAALALPLLGGAGQPQRWVALGPMQLYAAPVVLPALIAVLGSPTRRRDGGTPLVLVPVASALLLALQPDASQATALLVGTATVARGEDWRRVSVALTATALAAAWAWTQLDPLAPVPYVEGVFALALGASSAAGVAVVASALVFVAALWAGGGRATQWLAGIASYYAVLYACSVAGLTPAPLIGFGTGPVLGFGLLVAIAPTLREPVARDHRGRYRCRALTTTPGRDTLTWMRRTTSRSSAGTAGCK